MIRNRLFSGMAMIIMAFSSCNNSDELTIGSSLTSETDKLDITTATFDVTTRTITVDSVIARTGDCYFGRVMDPETDAYITADFMSQYHILETFTLTDEDSIVSRIDGQVVADSCELVIYLQNASTFCDSLAAMKMRVTELVTPVEDGHDYYSNFDPDKLGYLRHDGLQKTKMFTWADMISTETEKASENYFKHITIPVNQPYTDKQGVTYNNYGTYILQQYYRHPEYFRNSDVFIRNVCPGFFFEITDGLGFHGQVPYTGIQIHYRAVSKDSVYNASTTLAGTDEVLQTIRITNEQDKLDQLALDNTCTYLKSPAGLFTEVTLPIDDIMQGRTRDSLLNASLAFQRINNNITDKTTLSTPQNVLLICKDSVDNFFAEASLADNVTSYTASFSSSLNQYDFTNISAMLTHLAQLKTEGLKTDPQWTIHHPNWNKLLLIPVHLAQVSTTSMYGISSTQTIAIEHDMSISSTRLVGGSENNTYPIQLKVIYGRFKDNK
jgi:hypothetical protein